MKKKAWNNLTFSLVLWILKKKWVTNIVRKKPILHLKIEIYLRVKFYNQFLVNEKSLAKTVVEIDDLPCLKGIEDRR